MAHIGQVAYKLLLSIIAKIHSVFHISQPKKAIGNHLVVVELPLELEVDASVWVEPKAILSSQSDTKHGAKITK